MQRRRPVHRTLLSVSDKAGIVKFAQALSTHGVELLSAGDTARLLAKEGLPVIEVSDCTGFPGMMDGRVKTLRPKMHGGILSRRGQDNAIMEERQIQPIDMVVVSLYPFAQTVAREGCSLRDAVENIDISGSTIVRSTTKNHRDAAIVMKNSDYDAIIKEVDDNEGSLALTTRFDLTIKAFEHTAAYSSMIANYFDSMIPTYRGESKEAAGRFPRILSLNFIKKQDMRYGESNHQQATFYIREDVKEAPVATAVQVQGKALSYNNITDIDAMLECVKGFAELTCVIVRHVDPCGIAIGNSILDAYDRAYKTDPTSAFGGITVFSRELDAETTRAIISRQFVEVIIAPSTSEEALKIIAAKQNVCVLTCDQWGEYVPGLDFKHVNGDLLVQDHDLGMVGAEELRVVTQRQSTKQGLRDALFCWKMAKFMKSNVIIYARNNMTIGIGADQTSRVYSAKIAGIKIADGDLEMKGFSMVSGAFFPFRGGIDAAVTTGITYVTQPDGSVRDDEVIAAADEHGIAMLFANMRYFRH